MCSCTCKLFSSSFEWYYPVLLSWPKADDLPLHHLRRDLVSMPAEEHKEGISRLHTPGIGLNTTLNMYQGTGWWLPNSEGA